MNYESLSRGHWILMINKYCICLSFLSAHLLDQQTRNVKWEDFTQTVFFIISLLGITWANTSPPLKHQNKSRYWADSYYSWATEIFSLVGILREFSIATSNHITTLAPKNITGAKTNKKRQIMDCCGKYLTFYPPYFSKISMSRNSALEW